MRFLYLISLLFIPSLLADDLVSVDSLIERLEGQQDDSKRIELLNEIAFQLAGTDPARALEFTEEALSLSFEIEDSSGISRSYNRKGVIFYYLGDYDKAINFYLLALRIDEELQNLSYIASDYNNLGLAQKELGNLDEALTYYNKAYHIQLETGNLRGQSLTLNNIGIIHKNLNDYKTALDYYSQSVEINHLNDFQDILALNYNNIGNIYIQQDHPQKALEFFTLSLQVNLSRGNKVEIFRSYNNIGKSYLDLDDYTRAADYLKLATDVAEELGSTSLKLENLENYLDYYKETGDFNQMVLGYEEYDRLKSEINNSTQNEIIARMQVLYETEKKDKEIELLTVQNEAKNEKIEKHKAIRVSLIISSILFLIIVTLGSILLRVRLTENKKLEKLVVERTDELEKARLAAEESNRLKTAFLSNMSHEVRTPMNAIMGYAGMLENSNLAEDIKLEFIKEISNGTLNMLNLFENITYLARLENDDLPINKEYCELKTYLMNVYNKYRTTLIKTNRIKEIELVLQIPEDNGQRILTDCTKLQMVFDNLIDNAIKFTDKGQVKFGFKSKGEGIKFFVEDTGIGIRPEHQARVFDKFRKFSDSSEKLYDGAGLGLAIAKGNIDLLGGVLLLESFPGQGTKFEFTLQDMADA